MPSRDSYRGSKLSGMTRKISMYKISEAKIRQIVRLFAVDLNALQIAELV